MNDANSLSLTTHAMDSLSWHVSTAAKNGSHDAAKHWGEVVSVARSAQIFKLPDSGKITGVAIGSMKSLTAVFEEWGNKIPFDKIVVEYADHSTNLQNDDSQYVAPYRVAVVWKIDYAEGCIAIAPMYGNKDVWAPPGVIHAIGANGEHGIVWECVTKAGADGATLKKIIEDGAQEIAAVAELIAALSCCNVSTKTVAAPAGLNRKRERSGKTPFFSYKVLEINVASESKAIDAVGGTHASPRVHLRRGHIRRLPSGNIWVNAHVVGDKSKGMVLKDYSVVSR